MQVNSTSAALNAQTSLLKNSKPAAQAATVPSPDTQATAEFSSGLDPQTDVNATDALDELSDPAGARQGVAFAMNSILNQSTLALLAQGSPASQTVFDLLRP